MTLKVFKYPVPLGDVVTIDMPYSAKILEVQMQRDQVCLWALVDPTDKIVTRRFRFAGTGHPIEFPWGELRYISTFQIRSDLVFHLFEITSTVESEVAA